MAKKIEKEEKEQIPQTNVAGEKAVANQVLCKVGQPPEFTRITTKNVFETCYRVNIWTQGPAYELIKDSFFVETNETNRITKSNPPLVKKYEQKVKGIECQGK